MIFLILSRDLVKKNFIYQENQKFRLLEIKENQNNDKILRKLEEEDKKFYYTYTDKVNDYYFIYILTILNK
jgi:hypothetical protein